MDAMVNHFTPPAPTPRTQPPSLLGMMKIVYNNPIELWGSNAYKKPYIHVETGIGGKLLVANDPELIRFILVDAHKSFKMARVRQLILRPILQDGLLTAENSVWKRSRKAMAPVFTPKHIHGFAETMKLTSMSFADRYEQQSEPFDMAQHMTELTFDLLSETLFSGQTSLDTEEFEDQIERLFETMARVDPLDILRFPEWIPRLTRIRGKNALAYFRNIVRDTVQLRADAMNAGEAVPDDFLTLLLQQEGEEGLSRSEIEDNVITFFGAGHETTARALGWMFYLLAKAPHERAKVEEEALKVTEQSNDPLFWVSNMPHARAAFDEAMRLYPPAPTISRDALHDIQWKDLTIRKGTQAMIMPWTLHRHETYWDDPKAFVPERFLPENRKKIDRYQYLPFGAGPRVCIGSSFAIQEALIVIAALMSRFRFDMAPGFSEPWPVQKLTTHPGGGLHMVATPL